MNDKSLRETVNEAIEQLGRAQTKIDSENVMENLRALHAGALRSPSLEAGGSTARRVPDDDPRNQREYLEPGLRGSDTHSDPTGSAAVQALNYGDKGADLDRELAKRARRIKGDAAAMVAILVTLEPRTSNVVDRALVAKENTQPEPGCDSCARVDARGAVGAKGPRVSWWNPVHSTVEVDGKTWRLCRDCYDGSTVASYRFTGRIPDVADVESWRDTGKARRRTA